MRAEFFLAEMKDRLDEGVGRIPRASNTGEVAVMLRPIRFQGLRVWISWTPLSTNLRTQFRLGLHLPERFQITLGT